MRLSIVTTLYRSEPHILEFYKRARACAEGITPELEIIFVNDGSPDRSLEVAKSLLRNDCVRILDLSRNFGHHKAMMTGLAHAKGDLVFLIDSDLEEDPELLLPFYERLRKSEVDVVYGLQTDRKGGIWERFSGAVFYKTLALLSDAPIPRNVVTARLMTARYVHTLVEHRDREVFIAGLWQITGYAQLGLPITKHDKGSSTYSLGHKFTLLVNAITSFSNRPLVMIFYLGLVIFLVSSAAAFYLILDRMFFRVLASGWPSLIVSVWLLGGLTLFCLGLIGIYVSKIFMETKDRPYTTIRDIYESAPKQ